MSIESGTFLLSYGYGVFEFMVMSEFFVFISEVGDSTINDHKTGTPRF